MQLTSSNWSVNTLRTSSKKKLLPRKAQISIPVGLDWIVKQRLTSAITFARLESPQDSAQYTDLVQINNALTRTGRIDMHLVELYGYELTLLYSFLLRQEQSYSQWSTGLVPHRAQITIHAQLRAFLPQLRAICRQVDVYANRPAFMM
jgi:hypothetical protein